jgi:hypothetical protein
VVAPEPHGAGPVNSSRVRPSVPMASTAESTTRMRPRTASGLAWSVGIVAIAPGGRHARPNVRQPPRFVAGHRVRVPLGLLKGLGRRSGYPRGRDRDGPRVQETREPDRVALPGIRGHERPRGLRRVLRDPSPDRHPGIPSRRTSARVDGIVDHRAPAVRLPLPAVPDRQAPVAAVAPLSVGRGRLVRPDPGDRARRRDSVVGRSLPRILVRRLADRRPPACSSDRVVRDTARGGRRTVPGFIRSACS